MPPNTDSDLSNDDDGYGDTRPLSYSETETERKKKIRFIDRVIKKRPKSPPLEIDDKDTDPRPLSYSDSEQDRGRKLNYIKKYASRKKMKMPKFPVELFKRNDPILSSDNITYITLSQSFARYCFCAVNHEKVYIMEADI